MKVAILGAGMSGLAAGVVLERHGFVPDIYEQNSFISDHYSHIGVLFNMAYRGTTKQPLKYIKKTTFCGDIPPGKDNRINYS
ncbi:NAD(P)-binding protein [Desulforamulus aquiferis]|uniref:NAD(P)-binding protein n=1 Tax=Desulforamulus aquiferis TaxID=1397668 RepID=A0AAW7ZAZ4_9FIRM|nr:NAD(P)-binding protein [Desulforamulus aquiferis]MDO7786571.1 NAD(P)-binding protein [Desulforamulus aquiferis]